MAALQLNRDAIRQPVQAAVVRSTEMVNFCAVAMEAADLSQAPKQPENKINFKAPEITADDRRVAYEAWILARGFHDVLRGMKEGLEQAYVYLGLHDKQPTTQEELAALEARLKKKAQRMGFKDLLEIVNPRLSTSLEFPDAYLSLQQARNCLEHRGGIVGTEDCNAGSKFRMSFPRIKLYYLKNGEEVEIESGITVDSEDGQPVQVLLRLDVRHRELAIGDRLSLKPAEFNEIAFAANLMGEHLANRLP